MKLIHLSDLHLNLRIGELNTRKTEHLLEKAFEIGFDHLVITGDITHYADRESFILFRDILNNYNLLNSNLTSIVIGNHDIYGGIYSVKDLLEFPENCKLTDYEKKVNEFIEYYNELFVDCFFPSNYSMFPYAKIFSNYVLIGLNTNARYSLLRNPFASNGKLAKTEYNHLLEIFNHPLIKEKQKIILAHHHFYKNNFDTKSSTNNLWNKIEGYTLKLKGKKKLIKTFKKYNVSLVLHGHSHENKFYSRMGVNFLNAGGSVDNDSENSYLTTINFTEDNSFITEIELIENTKFEFAVG